MMTWAHRPHGVSTRGKKRRFRQDLEQAADLVSQTPLGNCWFRLEGVVSTSLFAGMLQATCGDLSQVDLDPEGLLIGLGSAATGPESPLDFHQHRVQQKDRK